MNILTNLAQSWAQYRTFRATLAELQMCSDRQLADMGFVRGDLARVAYEAAELTAKTGERGHATLRGLAARTAASATA